MLAQAWDKRSVRHSALVMAVKLGEGTAWAMEEEMASSKADSVRALELGSG